VQPQLNRWYLYQGGEQFQRAAMKRYSDIDTKWHSPMFRIHCPHLDEPPGQPVC
jgi:hypothetical protein